jgi:hypothetical protein
MTRWQILTLLLLTLCSCAASEPKTTFIAHGQRYCAIHRIPLVTAHGFEAPGVEPVLPQKDHAIDYAQTHPPH